MQALAGSFDTVELSRLLGFLARSRASGMLQVESILAGRVYFEAGALTYATTRKDETEPLHTPTSPQSPADRRTSHAADLTSDRQLQLLSQQLPEVLVRLLRPGYGTFTFETDVAAPIPVSHRFNVPDILQATQERMAQWTQITEVLPSGSTPVALNPLPPPQEVRLDSRSWSVAAALASSGTASGVAQQLKIFEFSAAQEIAELIRRGLATATEEEEPAKDNDAEEATTAPKSPPPSPLFHEGRTTHLLLAFNTSTSSRHPWEDSLAASGNSTRAD